MAETNSAKGGFLMRRAADWLAEAERAARARDARRALGRASGLRDEALLDRLCQLGVTPETLPALELVPAILVGWAEGMMTRLERDRLRALAALRGIDEAHPAWSLVQHWMLQRPSDEDGTALLAALSQRLTDMRERSRLRRRRAILDSCDAVARAAGRVLGGPKVSREEREMLARIEACLTA